MKETHISIVFIAGERVYKVKKAIALPFLDYSTPALRLHFCEEEVRLNRRLAPHLYLGVRAIVAEDGRLRLGEPEELGAVEYAVEMLRIDPDRTLEALVVAGEANAATIERVTRWIADFHAGVPRAAASCGGPADVKARQDENFRSALAFVGAELDASVYAAAERFSDAFVLGHRREISERAYAGWIKEGHGDLRAEHIVLENGGVAAFDCVEFDRRLRSLDIASELAFLYMDLERLGAVGLAAALERAYAEHCGDPGGGRLLQYYACYRAWVRVKTICLQLAQLEPADPQRESLAVQARALSELSLRFAWRSRRPVALVFCGVAASGKSLLAEAVAGRSGFERVGSDVIRKQLGGVPLEHRAPPELYSDAVSARVYAELERRARMALAEGGGVVIDATLTSRRYRQRLCAPLRAVGARVLLCECRAPVAMLRERAAGRKDQPERGSDATWEVVRGQLRRFQRLDEVPAADHLVLRTDRSPADALRRAVRVAASAQARESIAFSASASFANERARTNRPSSNSDTQWIWNSEIRPSWP